MITSNNYANSSNRQLVFPSSFFFHSLTFENKVLNDPASYIENCYIAHPFWLLVGICEDNLPLTIDIRQPDLKPIIIASDARTGKTKLLQSILFFALKMSSIQLTINVISNHFSEWDRFFTEIGLCKNIKVFSWEDTQLKKQLSNIVSSDKLNRKNNIYRLTLLDGIEQINALNSSTKNLFCLMLEAGRTNNNLCIASIDTDFLIDTEDLLALFDTTVLGLIYSLAIANQRLKLPAAYRKSPRKGEFYVWHGTKWLKFYSLF